ncbi:adenylate/guanylate cyclase domain-containing protein [Leisingera sp.]|uniref:adenylate/guanylate cyclase domain-containing protein n=1 Tax=Leisingera sp. TaxID=1879318 RepID=UPI002B276931|nr:adenylate/guanylate cyclase domain-containing protein [Leisingera sp.]
MQRRLAAILAADIVGYSSLMDEDEAGTLAALKTHRAELFYPETEKRGGRIVKLMGDGALVEFRSILEAVECALAIQKAMAASNGPIRLRIGLNLGDVVADGEDIYGDGVNVAVRLEGLAEPGGVCISSVVRESLGKRIEAEFTDDGAFQIKGKPQPIHVWRWHPATGPEPARPVAAVHAGPAGTQANFDLPAIAVLPLANHSGDPEQEFFADGLTDDIITALTYWRTFPVIARHSCFEYKGRDVNVIDAGRELGARYILEGSIRKGGGRIRISVLLVDCSAGHHVWAEKYDRELTGIFEVQDDIVQCIAAHIAPEVALAEARRSSVRCPADLDAWELCLRALPLVRRRSLEGVTEGRALFKQAIALRPGYADAHAGLAMSYNMEILIGETGDRFATAALAMEAARAAIECDEASSFAHHELSTAYQWLNRVDDALAEARTAVELNPNDAYALHALGNKSDLAGDPQGISLMEKAQELNPADAQLHSHLTFLARAYVNSDMHEAAVDCARRAIRREPEYAPAHYILASALACLDRMSEALQSLQDCETASQGFVEARRGWQPYISQASNERLLKGIRKIALQSKSQG